jgi:hypothetical protein
MDGNSLTTESTENTEEKLIFIPLEKIDYRR